MKKESWVGDAQNSDIILNASASLTFILSPTHPQFLPNLSNLFTWLHLYHDSSPSDCHVPPGLSVVTLLPLGVGVYVYSSLVIHEVELLFRGLLVTPPRQSGWLYALPTFLCSCLLTDLLDS